VSERLIEVGRRIVNVIEQGEGAPLLYLHGFADVHGVSGSLFPFHEQLARHRRLIAPAHPGVNGSDELEGYSVDDVVYSYLELLDALKIDRFDLIGHCAGGWIAAEIAVRHPERVRSLGLIGATGLFIRGQLIADVFMHAQPERGVDYTTLRRTFFSSADAPLAQRYFPNGRGDIDEETRRYGMLRFGSFFGFKPPYFYNRSLIDRLGRADMPAFVAWGESDAMTPLSHGEAYARGLARSAPLMVVKGAGHAAHLESPEVTKAFEAFLAAQTVA
jgi:pimeloyl-ACP methyl ester carboxylesterase